MPLTVSQLMEKMPGAFIPEGSTYRQDQIADRQAGFYSRYL